MPDFETYLSPFSWRYGSEVMRRIWSEANNRRLWRHIWAVLAEVQVEFGLLKPEQAEIVRQHAGDVDLERSLQIEAEIHHDLMAELRVFAEQCGSSGGLIHLGATAMDVKDNADVLRIRQALDLVLSQLITLLKLFAQQITRWADLPLIAYTHLQPAEPSTLGYRLAQIAQDLLSDWHQLTHLREGLRGKGIRGAVGTGASFAELIGLTQLTKFEARLSAQLELSFFPVVTQTYPRKQDYQVVSALAGLGGTLYKFAFDLRLLQSPPMGELSEPFGEHQVGSSAMPFKRNPIQAEKINALARFLAQLPRLAWDNAAHSLLERTLDDSANRRMMLPESFLIADELLRVALHILVELRVNENAIVNNLKIYGPFAATERVLMALSKAGADRQAMHARLRLHSLSAWERVQAGQSNPLTDLVSQDEIFLTYLSSGELKTLMNAQDYVGDAPQRAHALAQQIEREII